jgi:hypothetical protein
MTEEAMRAVTRGYQRLLPEDADLNSRAPGVATAFDFVDGVDDTRPSTDVKKRVDGIYFNQRDPNFGYGPTPFYLLPYFMGVYMGGAIDGMHTLFLRLAV